MSQALFCIENLRVAYPQPHNETTTWAINDVSFTLQPGETMGLVGESGCGKSTLGRAAMRLLPPFSRVEGQVTFQGESVLDLMPHQLRKFRGEAIALIFQDPMTRLDPLMTIGQHCIETLQAHLPKLSTKEAKVQAIATLEKVNIPASRWYQYPHEFSGGMRQRVAIALALLLNPKLIIADEPTTSLDVTVSAQILQELTRLCSEENMALLLISHDLAMVGEYCHRIGVMHQGKIVEMGATKTVLRQPQHEYTRSLLKAALHIQTVDEKITELAVDNQEQRSLSPILRITELRQHYTIEANFIQKIRNRQQQTIKAVDGINLELYPGEIFGLVGESGCGKSTLSKTILQLIRPTAGKVEFLGQDLTTLSRPEIRSWRRQMQMIFQDPHACLNPVMTVGQSIADPLFIHNLADAEKAKSEVSWMLEKVGLTPPQIYYQRYPSDLSGGQQQRVAIARALITRPKLLICDEPVSMLDASVQSQVIDLMLALKTEFELTYLFITHDLWLARFLCHRIAVMHSGKIVELGNTKQIFTHPQHPYTKTLLAAAPLLARV
ncbi:dipeptide ABC transporter ATP-binding protein [Umezakia ovalisporum]|jgi:peptide/nickel transport system ATP-binding protein|uniref:ABC transporter ATP-binding protein n=2 Tax=Umezakia ovalisporum TaxID=75695 RepID=A0AA43H1Y8_9CYAN|nr:ABC transporter ATP-binding protein [Umezakia ovalisporum]MBI1242099.1 dipeptide ABC transporter ATP-binding protein [Nostoc sp. RI_552]MDH6056710.1 ABC transporter ATP-binding protein [Umezakia ovalisporum FSS-43]MDH6065678.1 ABC transporter ATP-binding protein [Umezakia ovalisporum FSS-62]MDH6068666.1 ABC transporter ATP-binding protein [Umezakia ovalisporum APH033B]MDH6070108.1 ABC transporter ATP-binding protein [Umezakia ovalisporum CobakiLakeA]